MKPLNNTIHKSNIDIWSPNSSDRQLSLNDEYKNKTNNILNNKITNELANVFWLNKEKVHTLNHIEINEISDKWEINTTEAKLAVKLESIFWMNIYNNLLSLASNRNNQPMWFASVMADYDEYEDLVLT